MEARDGWRVPGPPRVKTLIRPPATFSRREKARDATACLDDLNPGGDPLMSTYDPSELTRKKCAPCEGGVPPLSVEESRKLLSEVPGWEMVEEGKKIRRAWTAKNFKAGIDFFNKVAALAEDEGHHPDLHLAGYRNVSIEMTTHAVGGLTENDFILAAKINEIPIQVKKQS
jgi:4a-hydroxytetrahydrobiopterin dehydratase